jgi:branched-chain amino acid transport system ATP-binding protein
MITRSTSRWGVCRHDTEKTEGQFHDVTTCGARAATRRGRAGRRVPEFHDDRDRRLNVVDRTAPPMLETRDLTVTFGGLNANDGVDIVVPTGSFVGLIGPNGAGKTTFIDAITGFVPTSRGTAMFDGRDLLGLPPHRRAGNGLVRTFQSLELFEDLSVEDNLYAAADDPPWWGFLADMVWPTRSRKNPAVERAIDAMELEEFRDALPQDLSHGQRKLVGVARALAADPKLILLDEPAAGLDTTESQLLGQRLRRFLDGGMTVFLIDHDMGLVLSVCDYIYVLDFGVIIAEGTPKEIREHPDVIRAYLGAEAGELQAAGGDAARHVLADDASAVLERDQTSTDGGAES